MTQRRKISLLDPAHPGSSWRRITFRKSCQISGLIVVLFAGNAFSTPPANQVSVEGHGFSLRLEPAPFEGGNDLVFTTYDGNSGAPLTTGSGATTAGSDEMRPASEGSSTYLSDYLFLDSGGGITEYGTLALTINENDTDGNGIFDIHQIELNGDLDFAGSTSPDFNSTGTLLSLGVTGSVARSASSLTGTYDGTATLFLISADFSGEMEISRLSGTATYTPADSGQLSLALTHSLFGSGATTFTGSASFSVVDQDQL